MDAIQTPQRPRSPLHAWDQELAKLRAANPGWHVWYVPCNNGNELTVTWCAQPLPLLRLDSTDALQAAISEADAWRQGAPNTEQEPD